MLCALRFLSPTQPLSSAGDVVMVEFHCSSKCALSPASPFKEPANTRVVSDPKCNQHVISKSNSACLVEKWRKVASLHFCMALSSVSPSEELWPVCR